MGWGTPLCPAGHLPLKGGDRMGLAARLSLAFCVEKRGNCLPFVLGEIGGCGIPISPLEGEMAGKPEGGNPTHKAVPFWTAKGNQPHQISRL
ncbi:hypothetical protein FS763_07665 [Agrobacterium vitis]|nr:hypothetical protein [Allorhizobium ampelinum]